MRSAPYVTIRNEPQLCQGSGSFLFTNKKGKNRKQYKSVLEQVTICNVVHGDPLLQRFCWGARMRRGKYPSKRGAEPFARNVRHQR